MSILELLSTLDVNSKHALQQSSYGKYLLENGMLYDKLGLSEVILQMPSSADPGTVFSILQSFLPDDSLDSIHTSQSMPQPLGSPLRGRRANSGALGFDPPAGSKK